MDSIVSFFTQLLYYITGPAGKIICTVILAVLGLGFAAGKVPGKIFFPFMLGIGICFGAKFLIMTITGG